jgi:hypothetical protein
MESKSHWKKKKEKLRIFMTKINVIIHRIRMVIAFDILLKFFILGQLDEWGAVIKHQAE